MVYTLRFLGVTKAQMSSVTWLTGKVDWVSDDPNQTCPKYASWTSGSEFSPFTGLMVDPAAHNDAHPTYRSAGSTRLSQIVCQYLGPTVRLQDARLVTSLTVQGGGESLIRDGLWDVLSYLSATVSNDVMILVFDLEREIYFHVSAIMTTQ